VPKLTTTRDRQGQAAQLNKRMSSFLEEAPEAADVPAETLPESDAVLAAAPATDELPSRPSRPFGHRRPPAADGTCDDDA
jgi:hypothetical protein